MYLVYSYIISANICKFEKFKVLSRPSGYLRIVLQKTEQLKNFHSKAVSSIYWTSLTCHEWLIRITRTIEMLLLVSFWGRRRWQRWLFQDFIANKCQVLIETDLLFSNNFRLAPLPLWNYIIPSDGSSYNGKSLRAGEIELRKMIYFPRCEL